MYFQEVVAFILVKQDKFLAEKRKQTKKVLPGALVIPVGKVEPGEQTEKAMLREAEEELSIIPKDFRIVCTLKNEYPDHISRIHFFMINSWEGEVTANEAEELLWMDFKDKGNLTLKVDQIAIEEMLRTRNYLF
jgi:mutator protein MutT